MWRVGRRFSSGLPAKDLQYLRELERKVIWLSTYTIHHANNIRPNRDGIKVGGHQASSCSLSTVLTALYFRELKARDRVAVKPHASPIFHAIQYILGNQTIDNLKRFRALGGIQSYPSRTKDLPEVDFSTGSVGLGAATTLFSAINQEYLVSKNWLKQDHGRMITLVGDAELDEGNVYEALIEGWKHKVQDNWWFVDYNRQSLDKNSPDKSYRMIERMFRATGFDVVMLRYGKKLREFFKPPAGKIVKRWYDQCANDVFSAMCFQKGPAFRARILADIGSTPGVQEYLSQFADEELFDILTNVGGHDFETLFEAFECYSKSRNPVCFILFTIKGNGLPIAGHRDNHGLYLNQAQIDTLQESFNIPKGEEWEVSSGLSDPQLTLNYARNAPIESLREAGGRETDAPRFQIPNIIKCKTPPQTSTQMAFGQIMLEIAKSKDEYADRVVTTAPDVATTTNLSPFMNRRGVWAKDVISDHTKEVKVASLSNWGFSPKGQHIQLGIAESNLFLLLASLGLSGPLFGQRLLPIGTLYDPFIARGLDSLNYGCYQDSRFIIVGTPSGITLAPEGGAHQSSNTQLIGMAQPNLLSFEPSYSDELQVLMAYSLRHIQDPFGCSIYLRLSTRSIPQPEREMTPELQNDIIAGGYWMQAPSKSTKVVIAYSGVIAMEVMEAAKELKNIGLLHITSPDRLVNDWQKCSDGTSHLETLLGDCPKKTQFLTVLDGHPASLTWIGGVYGHKVKSIGVNRFGQSADIMDIYKEYGIDANSIKENVEEMLK